MVERKNRRFRPRGRTAEYVAIHETWVRIRKLVSEAAKQPGGVEALQQDPQFGAFVEALRRNSKQALKEINAELMRADSQRFGTLRTTREHFAGYVRELSREYVQDLFWDAEECIWFCQWEPNVIQLHLVDSLDNHGINRNSIPAIVIRVADPLPSEIDIITTRNEATDRARVIYDELLDRIEQRYGIVLSRSRDTQTPAQSGPVAMEEHESEALTERVPTLPRVPPFTQEIYDLKYKDNLSWPQVTKVMNSRHGVNLSIEAYERRGRSHPDYLPPAEKKRKKA